ncbi:MAG: NTP transferase domain-containing protein [Candidatus Helarchaeota archaeon]
MLSAIILAAGKGTRLALSTSKKVPKCLLLVDGISILERLIISLIDNNIKRIYIVVGHLKEKIIDHIKNIKNRDFCKIISSENYLKGPIFSFNDIIDSLNESDNYVLCPGDLLIDQKSISKILTTYFNKTPKLLIAIDRTRQLHGITVSLKEKNSSYGLVNGFNFTNNKKNYEVKIIPMIGFSRDFLKYIPLAIKYNYNKIIEAMNLYLLNSNPINYIDLSGAYWFDVDTDIIYNEANEFFVQKSKL